MARRNDGTSIRYDVQIFMDNREGRAIANRLYDVRSSGQSVSEFIREAIWFYMQHESGAVAAPVGTSLVADLERKIESLLAAVSHPTPAAAASTPKGLDSEAGMVESSGLDLSGPRRGARLTPASSEGREAEPKPEVYDSAALSQQLLASIKAFGQSQAR